MKAFYDKSPLRRAFVCHLHSVSVYNDCIKEILVNPAKNVEELTFNS
ncbi:hypothetical protein AW02_032460 [Bacillus velezensis NJN-6]|nr:hypothetical protein AW02_032460 [Bacillus velezensis NJN-6]MCW5195179.1 hypothetical protein [Bacillus amyloliquefaciens]PWK00119.1 hypothetical protein C7819_104113 [Bacillus sp. VMFN-A1]QHM87567.1 hypothetical protein DXY21_01612 [Bacillus velezensis]COC81886.1 Uncharacterised protein [Streptococcus pneumoniae]